VRSRRDGSLPWVRQLAAELVDDIEASSGPFDFVAKIAAPFPLRIICRMMGVPWHHGDEILRLTTLMLGGMDPELQHGIDDPIQAYGAAAARMVAIVEEIAELRREKPEDDLISALVHGDVDGECLTASEIGSFFILLVAAGSETTRTAIAHGLVLLTEHPVQKERWRADPGGLSQFAVEEIVRFASPVTFMRRTATRETELSGVQMKEGDKVILLYGAANRDEAIFENPERFDVTRSPNPHLGYGAPGPHFCLGASLARREVTVMWEELLR
jgi:cytochrome P450